MAAYLRDDFKLTCGLTVCTPGSAPGPTFVNDYETTLRFYMIVAVMCEGGRQYSPCSSPCRRTCRNAALPVDSYCAMAACVEGCYCPSDTVESGSPMMIIKIYHHYHIHALSLKF